MAKVTEYPRITKMKDNDILLVDGPDGTRTILQTDASKQMGGEVIMVNETAGDSTKVVINTTNEDIVLATMADLEPVEEDVSELKTQLETLETGLTAVEGGAVIYLMTMTDGYIDKNDGSEKAEATWCKSDFVDLNGATELVVSSDQSANNSAYNAFYNASKEFISNFSTKTSPVTVPSNAKYFRVSYDKTAKVTVSPSIVTSVIDVKNALNYTGDIINNSLSYRYTNFVQGTIDSSGGDVDNSNWTRTGDFIPIESVLKIEKPVGVQITVYYYDATKTHLRNVSWTYSVAESSDFIEMRKANPTCKYIKVRARTYIGSTAQKTTPAKIIDSGLNIIVASAINDGHIEINDLTLSANYRFEVPYFEDKYKNMIFTIRSKYTGTQPTIQFLRSWRGSDGGLHEYYMSAAFPVGDSNYVENSYRIPRYFETSGNLIVNITVPSGSTLTINRLFNTYSDDINMADSTIKLNAHGKCGCGAPANTLAVFNLAHKMGYKYCITIPKITSDGVLVCLHDDTIYATARNDDGTHVAEEYQTKDVSTCTYNELLQFDFGINRGVPFKGERIPKLEDFFLLCAKTGMHPMLSCHPSLSGHWNTIKNLAIKYNLLDKLNIKCDHSNIAIMMTALGDDIESYTIDESNGVDRVSDMTSLINNHSIDTTKCRCGIEYITTITDALITSALNAGYFVGYANYLTDATTVKGLIAKGVTEFTDDYIASAGLNW